MHRSFTTPPALAAPPTFDIDGRDFVCVSRMSGAAALEFAASGDDGQRAADAILRFLRNAVCAEQRAAFNALLDDPDVGIPIETLNEIAEFLVEAYTARPTVPPSAPSDGSRRNGATTEAVPSVTG